MFSDPVAGERFFGRVEALDLLTKRTNALKEGYRQNIAIVGPQLIGKSSLVLHFFFNRCPANILPIYIELSNRAFEHFTRKFTGSLLYQYLKSKNLDVALEIELLKKHAQPFIPKTVKVIQAIEIDIENRQVDHSFEKLLSLTEILKNETGLICAVILDEFQLLDTFKLKKPFSVFAREIMTQKDTMYVLISSQVNYAQKILAEEISLLFGNFEVIKLGAFDYDTSCKFIEKRLGNLCLPETLRDFLISFSEGHPFYLDILSNKLAEKSEQQKRIEICSLLIGQTLDSVIYDSQGILNQYFLSLLASSLNGYEHSDFISILLSMTKKESCLEDIAEAAQRSPQIIAKQINLLVEKDLINKVGVFFKLQDKIFKFWLKEVYQRKNLSIAVEPIAEKERFFNEIENKIHAFSREAKKPLQERVIALLQSCANETIKLQHKSYKFWKFEEVSPWPMKHLEHCIIARYKDGCWAFLVKKGALTETRIQQFCLACKKVQYKVRKKIIVAASQLDLNVKLMALEKNIWIWSLDDINLLFDIYGKEQILGHPQ
ncbi:MAG: ATP-binding protein [Candidatus Omnitrophota bacterium]